jgi:hypothetical protein
MHTQTTFNERMHFLKVALVSSSLRTIIEI